MGNAEKQAGIEPRAAAQYRARVRASMLWAAWADAVGFISELTSLSGLSHRTGGRPLTGTLEWTRRVGGQYGVAATMPAGTYSDDTQLRLAVARSISDDGFDVETFARIELPVWPAYALGGGRASRAAAASMAKPNATWKTNFYDGWTKAGGNGAAMRVQPHVWAGSLDDDYVVPVLRDSVVTHGHPRALVGAVLHAITLAFALREGRPADVNVWGSMLSACRRAVRFFNVDADLAQIWVPSWEQHERRSFQAAWEDAVDECAHHLRSAADFVATAQRSSKEASPAYRHMVGSMGLTEKSTLGSATATVTAAMALAAAFVGRPADASLLAAQTVGTDTDTIATIAAATIAAAAGETTLPGAVQDERYLLAEADRLTDIALHRRTPRFAYPDTLTWKPPSSQLDAVGTAGGHLGLAGISWLAPHGPSFTTRDAAWTWTQSAIGASFLVKHRLEPRALTPGNWPAAPSPTTPHSADPVDAPPRVHTARHVPATLFDDLPIGTIPQSERAGDDRLARILEDLRHGRLTDGEIGRAVRTVAEVGTAADFSRLARELRALLRSIR